MHPQTEYIVVIKPAKPQAGPVGSGISGYTISPAPGARIKEVMADNAEAAAEAAGVKAGETALVLPKDDVQTFSRPDLAPLIAA